MPMHGINNSDAKGQVRRLIWINVILDSVAFLVAAALYLMKHASWNGAHRGLGFTRIDALFTFPPLSDVDL